LVAAIFYADCNLSRCDLGFRVDGKIIERPIDIGSTIVRGYLDGQVFDG
jgi:hypothetical protein